LKGTEGGRYFCLSIKGRGKKKHPPFPSSSLTQNIHTCDAQIKVVLTSLCGKEKSRGGPPPSGEGGKEMKRCGGPLTKENVFVYQGKEEKGMGGKGSLVGEKRRDRNLIGRGIGRGAGKSAPSTDAA